ncbi:acetyl/propionyl/methylcrotonyl-CoA carboxylase subunit alpha [Phyllobacterium salinisoli]|uniref:Acetyl/propionyl/methylcrotonyl-CoA carboxylase subunit alpha n=1 Tax=Phyllobacterium salinisoli TaxID=1899321 RepID=A0A368K1J2_9HYPH|nr:acetyl/propionyl/methylcrotonyl-CoA carboxylase subunit alpha [Phyllobacterium salinisoli]RCS23258.1 acetyl/propionyl/methylcrotonyl-CoA carboxylase subunit alpha [Phyllobacterium salinisoli]
MFSRILIANRGEIAVRIIRTARRLGIGTVAVYSDADADALHVELADEAVHIGPSPAAESYLKASRIIKAAKAAGAEAIHPGYGFLSENPDFVEAVERAGLVFIGPSAASIRAMGLKDAAKRLMEKAGVPVVPGYHGEAQDLVVLATKAREIGYPVLIKARAGGGGKGMRRVDHPDDFAEALASARREAKSAFGDDKVLVEKYIARPRHIEVQVFGDAHGNAVHLFERDCSLQRRHQKVIEEAPAPGMTDAMRAAMTQAAVKAAKAIAYRGAGTVEFIADVSDGLKPDAFWFMEMNTRLQVEHPVTEMVTGLDLVEWQLRVAAGEPLPLKQADIALSGHAFEARLYAEDPARGFLPAIGTLSHLRFAEKAAGDATLRVDAGVREGDAIAPFYDPMIAKIIVHGKSRSTALAALGAALRETEIAGSVTNAAFLAKLSEHEGFAAGDVDTGLIERDIDALTAPAEMPRGTRELAALVASGLLDRAASDDPWGAIAGYSHFEALAYPVRLGRDEAVERLAVAIDGPERFTLSADEQSLAVRLRREGRGLLLTGPGIFLRATAARTAEGVTLFADGAAFHFAVPDPLERAETEALPGERLTAPMPGSVKQVRVSVGDAVKKGQPLLVLEAMKMEHAIAAPHDGTVEEIVAEGEQVREGMTLVRFAQDGNS